MPFFSSPTRIALLLSIFLIMPMPGCERKTPERQFTLYSVGDVMLGRHIAKVSASQGSDFPFQAIAPVLKQGDLVFGNMEAVIAPEDAVPFFPDKPYNFHASRGAAAALRNAGFNVMSLANNHALDYGPAALFETRALLASNGIETFGAGRDIKEARQPVIIMKEGIRIAFLGYGIAHSRQVYATKTRPGIAPLNREHIREDIIAVRKNADILIVSLHWGMEYDSAPSPSQQELAREIVDWGADMIVGHHPHVMQGVEMYRNSLIAYSLGNFIFDQKGKGTDRSFILASLFDRHGLLSGSMIPLERTKRYFPVVAQGAVRSGMLEELKNLSLPLNSGVPRVVKAGLRGQTTEDSLDTLLRLRRD